MQDYRARSIDEGAGLALDDIERQTADRPWRIRGIEEAETAAARQEANLRASAHETPDINRIDDAAINHRLDANAPRRQSAGLRWTRSNR